MFEQLKTWVESLLGSKYQYSMGAWVDNKSIQYICAIYSTGGAAADVDVRRPRFKILLVGPENGRQHGATLLSDIELLMQESIDGTVPCGAAAIRAMTEPSGVGYTEENRPFVSVDFQLTY